MLCYDVCNKFSKVNMVLVALGVNPILGNRCRFSEQNCVAQLQGSEYYLELFLLLTVALLTVYYS